MGMGRSVLIAGLLGLLLSGTVFAQRAETAEERAAARAARRAAAQERAKATDTPLERWQRMTPEERQRALAKLPPESIHNSPALT